jgi:hypothetical protein
MKKILAGTVIVVAGLLIFSAPNVSAQGGPCFADFTCDADVDGDDLTAFLTQFGRGQYSDPCPDCYDSPCPCTTAGCDPPAPVQKTGQTTSFQPGDDGDLEKGVTLPNPRFTDNGNGTVTDNLTGLIWLKDPFCFGIRTWSQAITDANVLASGSCGLTDGSNDHDWRLPNRRELFSLIDDNYSGPAISNTDGTGQSTNGDPFTDLALGSYWSSTHLAGLPGWAWFVETHDGFVYFADKSEVHLVWPVRGPE